MKGSGSTAPSVFSANPGPMLRPALAAGRYILCLTSAEEGVVALPLVLDQSITCR